jgi:hypothetical protein
MFYTNEEYKELLNIFLNERKGNIIKLKHVDNGCNKVIGNLIRAEIKNNIDEAIVIVNIALNERYFNHMNDRLKYSIKNLKYFSIKHILNFDMNKCLDTMLVNIENENRIIDYINEFNFSNSETIKYVLKNIVNVKKYYKNKKIKLFLI